MNPLVPLHNTTPTTSRRSGGPNKRRRICGAEVASQIMITPPPRPPSVARASFTMPASSYRGTSYQPNQSLYDGPYEQNLSDGDPDITFEQENHPHTNYNNAVGLTSSGPELVKMIQEQQHLLHQVLETQKQMQLKQQDFDDKLEELKKTSEAESSSSSPERTKVKVSRKLTTKVAKMYDSLSEGFKESEGSKSTFNAALKQKIIDEICAAPNCEYRQEEVKAAVQRKYESVRRVWKLKEKDDFEEVSKLMSVTKRYRARRKRKFENRAVVVRPTEMKYWKNLSIDEMSEESDDPEDPNTLIVHKLPWCSQELREFLEMLDARYQEKTKKEGVLVARKNRRIGCVSEKQPRRGIPKWALDANWAQSNLSYAVQDEEIED